MSPWRALFAQPPSPGVLALLALAFVLPGLFGHDPWKSFDAIGVEIVHQMYVSGDWLVPRIAGLKGEQQTALQEYAVAELVRQKERLAEYTTQARFAVAQLYDRASPSSTRDNANKP